MKLIARWTRNRWECLGVVLLLVGCDGRDARLERVVNQSQAQQAAQNHDQAKLHQEIVDGTKRLVEADATARQELVTMQHESRSDQVVVGQQRDALETERKAIVAERNRDQLFAVAMADLGLVLACLGPLLLAGYALYVATRSNGDDGVADLLVAEITSAQPLLLPAQTPPALPGPTTAAAPSSTTSHPPTPQIFGRSG